MDGHKYDQLVGWILIVSLALGFILWLVIRNNTKQKPSTLSPVYEKKRSSRFVRYLKRQAFGIYCLISFILIPLLLAADDFTFAITLAIVDLLLLILKQFVKKGITEKVIEEIREFINWLRE